MVTKTYCNYAFAYMFETWQNNSNTTMDYTNASQENTMSDKFKYEH